MAGLGLPIFEGASFCGGLGAPTGQPPFVGGGGGGRGVPKQQDTYLFKAETCRTKF